MDLYLIRHPAVATAPGLCYGSSDVGLRDAPAIGAALIAEKLAMLTGGASAALRISTSPLMRCATVAKALTDRPCVDAHLREIDFGRWEGVAWDAVPRDEIDAWAADIEHGRPHGGESVRMLADRTAYWLAQLDTPPVQAAGDSLVTQGARAGRTAQIAPMTNVAITHAGVIRVMTAQALQLPLLTCVNWPVDMAGICHLTRSDPASAWALARWNA